MYKIVATSRFKKDLKTVLKRGYDVSLLEAIVSTLAKGKELREEHKDHPLRGRWKGFRECHIMDDWLLIYRIENDILILTLTRTGTHSDLF